MKTKLLMFLFTTIFVSNVFGDVKGKTVEIYDVLKNVKQIELDNGLKVYLKEDHNLPIVSINTWLKVGSTYENDKNNGISHFLEHMLFKETKTRSVGEISKTIESHGGRINAGTSKDYTVCLIDIPSEELDTALDLMSDILQNATMPKSEVERERLVILEEIKRRDDDPDAALWDKFDSSFYSASKYRYRVIGTSETVNGITQEMLMDYYKRQYVAKKMSLVVVGDFDSQTIIEKIKKLFGTIAPGEEPEKIDLVEPEKDVFTFTEKKPVQRAYLLSGILGPTVESKDMYTLDLISNILGQGRTSRLYKNIREKKQIVYSIGASNYTLKGSGMFIVTAVGPENKIMETYKEIHQEIDNLCSKGVTDQEFNRVKTLIINGWLFGNETYGGQCGTIGYCVTLKDLAFAQNYLEQMAKINKDDVNQVMNKYFKNKKLSYVIFLPEK